jgi:hypothetical protein
MFHLSYSNLMCALCVLSKDVYLKVAFEKIHAGMKPDGSGNVSEWLILTSAKVSKLSS